MKYIVIMTRVKNSNLKKLALLSVMGIMCNNVEASDDGPKSFFIPKSQAGVPKFLSQTVEIITTGRFPRFLFYHCYFTHGTSEVLWWGIKHRNNYYVFHELILLPEVLQFGNHKIAVGDFAFNLPMLVYNFLAFGFSAGFCNTEALSQTSLQDSADLKGFGFISVLKQFPLAAALFSDCHLISYSFRSLVKIKLFSLYGLYYTVFRRDGKKNKECLLNTNWDLFRMDSSKIANAGPQSDGPDVSYGYKGGNECQGRNRMNTFLLLLSPRIHLDVLGLWNFFRNGESENDDVE